MSTVIKTKSQSAPPAKKSLGLIKLILINVIAVDSIRSLPVSAEYGYAAVGFYILAALVFMIPIALIATDMSGRFTKSGGIYLWVQQAFGPAWACLVAWIQWLYNVVWYPVLLMMLFMITFRVVAPGLMQNKLILISCLIATFWMVTLFCCFGLRTASWISGVGAVIGTVIPIMIIICLGFIWMYAGKPVAIPYKPLALLPSLSNMKNIGILTGMVFGLLGLEMSAVYAGEVRNPQRSYPFALIISVIFILFSMIIGSLAVAWVVPLNQLNLANGVLQAFIIFFNSYAMPWMIPVVALCMVVGGIAGLITWMYGPSQCLLIAARDGAAPGILARCNRLGAPYVILLLQAVIVTVIAFLYVFYPTINSSYWLLTDMTSQLALFMYIFVFAAAWVILAKPRPATMLVRLPLWLLKGSSALGLVACVVICCLGFIPPPQITGNIGKSFDLFLMAGIVIACLPPLYWAKRYRI